VSGVFQVVSEYVSALARLYRPTRPVRTSTPNILLLLDRSQCPEQSVAQTDTSASTMAPLVGPRFITKRQDVFLAVPADNSSPVPIWAFIVLSCAFVILLALAALVGWRLTQRRRRPRPRRRYPPRDPEVQRMREISGYYAPGMVQEPQPAKKKERYGREKVDSVEPVVRAEGPRLDAERALWKVSHPVVDGARK
jgi:MYXO-CTERM domain-containing protein